MDLTSLSTSATSRVIFIAEKCRHDPIFGKRALSIEADVLVISVPTTTLGSACLAA